MSKISFLDSNFRFYLGEISSIYVLSIILRQQGIDSIWVKFPVYMSKISFLDSNFRFYLGEISSI